MYIPFLSKSLKRARNQAFVETFERDLQKKERLQKEREKQEINGPIENSNYFKPKAWHYIAFIIFLVAVFIAGFYIGRNY